MTPTEVRAVRPLAETLQAVRAASGPIVIVMVSRDFPPVDRAMLIAAIGPLAVERAPGQRICALDLGPAALPEDVAVATAFLTGATSTTGQVLKVG